MPTGPRFDTPFTVNPVNEPNVVIFGCDAVVILPLIKFDVIELLLIVTLVVTLPTTNEFEITVLGFNSINSVCAEEFITAKELLPGVFTPKSKLDV